jgi:tight adherence protein C
MAEILVPIGAALAAVPGLATAPIFLAMLSGLGAMVATAGVVALRKPNLVAERLGTFGPAPRTLEDFELQRSFGKRVLSPMVQTLAQLVLRWTPGSSIEEYRRKLVLAGSQSGVEVRDFLGMKGLMALALGVGLAALFGTLGLGIPPTFVGIIGAVIGFYLPNFWLRRRIKRRQNAIQRSLPDALDLLTICVEAGLGFDAAVGRVAEKRDDELSREFGRVLTEMRMGRSRRDALRTLGERTDVADVGTFVSAIVQSEQLGVSISKVLLTQAEQMRVRRRQRAEELAHKAPIKMLFPMVFLIFPAIFVVILGPALPGIMKTLE